MMNYWKVKIEYDFDNHKETYIVKANSNSKALEFAKIKIHKKYPDIGDMARIVSIKNVTKQKE